MPGGCPAASVHSRSAADHRRRRCSATTYSSPAYSRRASALYWLTRTCLRSWLYPHSASGRYSRNTVPLMDPGDTERAGSSHWLSLSKSGSFAARPNRWPGPRSTCTMPGRETPPDLQSSMCSCGSCCYRHSWPSTARFPLASGRSGSKGSHTSV